MTEFMLAHPWLFTFQVAFVSLAIASWGARNTFKGDVHHHYHNNNKGE